MGEVDREDRVRLCGEELPPGRSRPLRSDLFEVWTGQQADQQIDLLRGVRWRWNRGDNRCDHRAEDCLGFVLCHDVDGAPGRQGLCTVRLTGGPTRRGGLIADEGDEPAIGSYDLRWRK